ncbi:MAG: hypothetical protein A4E37_01882 [Methanoregulaceae archaeon PtaB.Bin056]|nr:MAG: hypothetical protein A4E37_01882 [Methanoregulaceae archaeon PtaB.Bin056]
MTALLSAWSRGTIGTESITGETAKTPTMKEWIQETPGLGNPSWLLGNLAPLY